MIITNDGMTKLKLSSIKLLWFVGVYLLCTSCFSQATDYGLSFNGRGVKLDDRTQLNLTKNNSLNFNLDLTIILSSFYLKFKQEKEVEITRRELIKYLIKSSSKQFDFSPFCSTFYSRLTTCPFR